MTEQSIFELLLGSKLGEINPLLIPDAVSKISSAIVHDSDVIVKSSSYSNHYWKDNLLLLRNLCIKSEAHQHVDSTNISTILNFVGKSFKEKNEFELLAEEWAEEVAIEVEKMEEERRKRIREEEKKKLLIHEYWCKKLKELEMSTGIEWGSPTPPKDLKIETSPLIESLPSNNLFKQRMKTCQKDDTYRLKHIQFGYAIINLRSKCQVSKHLRVLLKSLAKYKEMYNYEKDFCKHLLKYIDQNPELLDFYSDNFFFILEIQIIETCTILITGTEEDSTAHLTEYMKTEDFKSLISACKLCLLIYTKVREVLFTLYYYSRLNLRIIHFLHKIDNAVKAS